MACPTLGAMTSGFQQLVVWQKAMLLTKYVYTLCDLLPRGETFGLASQIKRSAVSIPSNIAEGSKRTTNKDFRQFVAIAKGSAAELETQLMLAEGIYGISDSEITDLLKEVQKMLEVLSKRLV